MWWTRRVSPKSRGRPPGRGRAKRTQPVREPGRASQVLRSARTIQTATALQAELLASAWLGSAWAEARTPEPDPAEQLGHEIARRALERPTPEALAAVAALCRLVRLPALDDAFELLVKEHPEPDWFSGPAPEPVRAW